MHKKIFTSIAFIAIVFATANAQQKMKPEDTEYYTPVPPVVTPGKTCGARLRMPSYYLMEKIFQNGLTQMILPSQPIGMCMMEL